MKAAILAVKFFVGRKNIPLLAVPSDDAMAESYDLARTTLAASGYLHYEIQICQARLSLPNTIANTGVAPPYLGFGAGAHSFSGSQRWANHHDAAAVRPGDRRRPKFPPNNWK